ncbi:MAG: enoyl-CoA hydratase/isomerase family protein [Chitinophagaceae bacterium]|nr:enoyl-CoA hydratase/isomerase family protein [Chitinophagaceae bacterium]
MSSIITEIKGHIAILRLNRPEKFNSFNREMALALQKALDETGADKNIRAVLITGTGKAFCAGQDISELTSDNPVGINKILSEHYNPIVRRKRQLEKPVIAAVNGVAAGAGANMALCCDVVLAASNASFIQAFSKIGLIPDSGGTFFLPRLVGWQKASAIMMLGDKISPEQAERMGMIYKVLPADTFLEDSINLAHELAGLPTRGLAFTKMALNQSMQQSWEQQLATEDELQQKAANTHDYREGITAFLEKRPPQFKGE